MTAARKIKPAKNPAPAPKLEAVKPTRESRAKNPKRHRRAKRRKKNMSTGAKIAIAAGVVLVGVPLVLITAAALGFRSLVRSAEKDQPSKIDPSHAPEFVPTSNPKWLYWTEPAGSGYWDSWVQRPDGQQIKVTQAPLLNQLEATSMALTLIRDNGGSPVMSLGRPST